MPAASPAEALRRDDGDRLTDCLEAHRTGAFDEDAVAGAEHLAEGAEAGLDAGRPARQRDAAGALDVSARQRPDGDEHLYASPRRGGADLPVVRGRAGPELGHVAQHGDLAAAGRT